MNDEKFAIRPVTRQVSPNWPFLYGVEPGRRGLVKNVPAPGGPRPRTPLVEPAGPRKITATDWPFPTDRPALTQRVKLRPDAVSVYDLFPEAPF